MNCHQPGIITELYVNKLNRIKSKMNTIKSYCTERVELENLFPDLVSC